MPPLGPWSCIVIKINKADRWLSQTGMDPLQPGCQDINHQAIAGRIWHWLRGMGEENRFVSPKSVLSSTFDVKALKPQHEKLAEKESGSMTLAQCGSKSKSKLWLGESSRTCCNCSSEGKVLYVFGFKTSLAVPFLSKTVRKPVF